MITKLPQVMVVEDDLAASKAIVMLFKHYGYETSLAQTLAEAMKMIEQPREVIILDLILPDGCGIDLIEKLRMMGSTARVIVLTGSSDEALERRVRRFSPQAIFHKPLNFLELLDCIRDPEATSARAA